MPTKKVVPFDIRNQTETTADLYFYGDIVSSYWEKWEDTDTAPEDVREVLESVKGKALDIYINSGGGSVFAGIAIYNMLKRHEGFKTVHVDGLAASIASVIALAGDTVIIPSNAFFMIHSPWAGISGNATDMRKMADDLDRIEEGILNIYAENLREGVSIETIQDMVKKETWLNGAEAAKYFTIETGESLEAVACASDYFTHYTEVPETIKNAEKRQDHATNTDEIQSLLLEIELL